MQRKMNVYWKTLCFDIEPVELEGPESSKGKIFLMNFLTFTVCLILVLPLPLTLATGAVLNVSQFDVAYYERNCHHFFSIDCPVHDHDSWICSKIITNCTSPDYPYHCILNTALKVVHVCAATQICHKGTVPIFNPRTYTVSCEKCQKGYYQPYEILSNNTPVCMQKFGCDTNYHKIECLVEPEKEQTQDTLCRCDARNDYILSHSESRDVCVPGKYADCYEWKCPDGQERLLNYTCAPRCREGFQRNDSDICVPKSTVIPMTLGVTEKASPTSTASPENSSKGNSSGDIDANKYRSIPIIVIAVFIAVILLIVVMVCWKWKLYKKCQMAINDLRSTRRQSSQDQTDELEMRHLNEVPNAVPEQVTMNDVTVEVPHQGPAVDQEQVTMNDVPTVIPEHVSTNDGNSRIVYYINATNVIVGANSSIAGHGAPPVQQQTTDDSPLRHSNPQQAASIPPLTSI